MKKLILPAFCLSLVLTSMTVSANTESRSNAISVSFSDDRKAIKPEELPEGVTKTLKTDSYKGWAVKEAAMVNPAVAADKQASEPYYEVTLSNEKETKIIKFQKDGTLLN